MYLLPHSICAFNKQFQWIALNSMNENGMKFKSDYFNNIWILHNRKLCTLQRSETLEILKCTPHYGFQLQSYLSSIYKMVLFYIKRRRIVRPVHPGECWRVLYCHDRWIRSICFLILVVSVAVSVSREYNIFQSELKRDQSSAVQNRNWKPSSLENSWNFQSNITLALV